MNYYSLFNLTKEPFANSPDPDLFYYSAQHQDCLQKLELALRLRRGLSVVIGAIGTGKSTMCRALLRLIDDDSGAVSAHLILDPAFTSPLEFLTTIVTTFGIKDDCDSEWQMKEAIKNYLLHQEVERNIIPVLIIDEGQKLPDFCIEILREFLNFETNQNKLLEIVIFAQEEFTETLKNKPNFSDRITSFHKLGPLSFKETREMIRYRIQQCRENGEPEPELFPGMSLLAIFFLSKGYPRKIVMLCSKILLSMLVKEKEKASLSLVWNSAGETSIPRFSGIRRGVYGIALLVFLISGVLLLSDGESLIKSVRERVLPSKVPLQQTKNVQSVSGDSSSTHKVEVTEVKKRKEAALPAVSATQPPVTLEEREKAESLNPVAETDQKDGIGNPPPENLGHVTVRSGMSISRMVTRVYGKYTDPSFRMVVKANTFLSDPARLKVGTKIFFPRLPDSTTSSLTPFLVSLGEFNSLQSAYDFHVSCPRTQPRARIVPLWDGASRLSFLVVLGESFQEEELARQAITLLDSRIRSSATTLIELGGIPL